MRIEIVRYLYTVKLRAVEVKHSGRIFADIILLFVNCIVERLAVKETILLTSIVIHFATIVQLFT